MTCPRCKCPECARVELNAALSRFDVPRETNLFHKPSDQTQSVELINSQSLRDMQAKSDWRDTVGEGR